MKITTKPYTTKFRGFGEIRVPGGTRVTNQTAMGADPNYHFVDEFDWVDEWYPKVANILKSDLSIYGLNIPKEFVEEWICTGPDTGQYRLAADEDGTVFTFMQGSVQETIDLDEYTGGYILEIAVSYGYKRKGGLYWDATGQRVPNAVLAECIFECTVL